MKANAKFPSPTEAEPGSTQVSVGVLFQAQLEDGKCIVLLDDRGFFTSAQWQQARPEEIRDTALAMVGPDEPVPGGGRRPRRGTSTGSTSPPCWPPSRSRSPPRSW